LEEVKLSGTRLHKLEGETVAMFSVDDLMATGYVNFPFYY
jgi:hypothetical protein